MTEGLRKQLGVLQKLQDDEQKLVRKKLRLDAVSETRATANQRLAQKVAAHRRHVEMQQAERTRRMEEAEEARAAHIRRWQCARRESLAAAGADRDSTIREHQQYKEDVLWSQSVRVLQKQIDDHEKMLRAQQHRRDRASAAQQENMVKAQRVQRVKDYQSVLEAAQRKYYLTRR